MTAHLDDNHGGAKLSWTDERVELLKKLWSEGLSASQIAGRLGMGVTRNAVIGKVHRLGLAGRVTPTRPARRPQRAARPRPTAAPVQPPRPRPAPVIVDVEPVRFANGRMANVLTLNERTCKWPIGDPTDENFGFCGHAATPGCPYCAEHAQMAYQPVARKKKAGGARDEADMLRWARIAAQ